MPVNRAQFAEHRLAEYQSADIVKKYRPIWSGKEPAALEYHQNKEPTLSRVRGVK